MILIVFEKEDKKLAIQISNKLQNKGFNTTFNNFSEKSEKETQNTEKIELTILIFSKKSNLSEKMIESYDLSFENQIPIIPFIISDVDLSVTMKHFLNTHDWINAFDVNTNESIEDLMILIAETKENPAEIKKEKYTVSNEQNTGKNKKQTYTIIAVSAIFIIILAYLIFGNKNNSPLNPQSNPNELIVGSWHLANYQDNMQRSRKDYIDFLRSVDQLKKNFLLKLSSDGTFEKLGFAQVEKGDWQLDPQKQILYMWPPNSKGKKDALHIEKLTTDTLIMSIATKVDSLTLVNTKFTLYKE